VASAQGPQITLDGKPYLNFSSNDYLGLATHPRLKEAAGAAIEKYGVGAGASRLICGNLEPYPRLEAALAEFKNKQAAIVFSSGYAANVGTICALVGAGDVVIVDKLCHASIIDGCRQSGATLRVYPHKHLAKLEALLRQRNSARTLVITETVYSMDGDLAPLPEIVELKDRYGAWLMIDEAHATGLFGANGRGAAELLGVEDRVDVTMGTLSKAIGCLGGYVAGSRTLIDYLRNKARSLIYSTALPPSVCSAAAESVRLIAGREGNQRRGKLRDSVQELRSALSKIGIHIESETAILPIVIGDEQRAVETSKQLLDRGIFVPAIRYPTVARGKARLRVTVTAAHTSEHIQHFARVLSKLWKP
jgi:8-amino-7-oxononanoate synthase